MKPLDEKKLLQVALAYRAGVAHLDALDRRWMPRANELRDIIHQRIGGSQMTTTALALIPPTLTLIQGGKSIVPAPAAATIVPAKVSRKRAKRVRQEDQFPVHCRRAPKNADLRGLSGLLTIEFRDGQPWEATFDPDDESVENVILPVLAVGAKGHDVIVSSDSGRWVFEEIVRQ